MHAECRLLRHNFLSLRPGDCLVVTKRVSSMLQAGFQALQETLLRESLACYGERLVSLVIFGSVARKTQRFDSDLDCLLVIDKLPRGRMSRIQEFDLVEERMGSCLQRLEHEGIVTRLSPILKTPEEMRQGSPLLLDMVEDAQILHDQHGFCAQVLQKLKDRLSALGAERRWQGNSWYWVLKPDFQPGEIFELF